jgi:uncharacterized protein YjgD (DUF1641 family)
MQAIDVEDQIAEINRKLDLIAQELSHQRQRRQKWEDLKNDLTIVGKDLYRTAVVDLEQLEQKGYFQFAREAAGIVDALVVSHSRQDLEQARASVPHLVGFLRELTRPEVLQALEAIVYGFGEVQAGVREDVSVLQLLRQLNRPDARRGLGILVRFLGVVGARVPGVATNESSRDSRKE